MTCPGAAYVGLGSRLGPKGRPGTSSGAPQILDLKIDVPAYLLLKVAKDPSVRP